MHHTQLRERISPRKQAIMCKNSWLVQVEFIHQHSITKSNCSQCSCGAVLFIAPQWWIFQTQDHFPLAFSRGRGKQEREYHNSSSKLGHWIEIYRAWRWKSWSCIHYAVTRLFMHEAQIGGDPFPAALVTTTQKIMHNPLVTTDFLFHWSLVKRQRNIEMDESRPSVFRAGWAALEIDVARVERFYFKIKLWSFTMSTNSLYTFAKPLSRQTLSARICMGRASCMENKQRLNLW